MPSISRTIGGNERMVSSSRHFPVVVPATAGHCGRPNVNSPSPGLQVPKPQPLHFSTVVGSSIISPVQVDSIPLSWQSILLSDALKRELIENTLNTSIKFLDELLPCERLPFPVDTNLLRKLSAPVGTKAAIWNFARNCFRQPPTDFGDFGEDAVCNWLNDIGAAMGRIYGRQCRRLWWSGNCGMPLPKRALILLDRSDYGRVLQKAFPGNEWAFVKSLVEVHRKPDTTAAKLYLTFLCQPHHRFIISLSFINTERGQFSITVTDRAGRIRVNTMDLMGSSAENGLQLLSILAFLFFGSPKDIGLDPNFQINPVNGQVVAIKCGLRRFEVVKRVHALQSPFGRGTQVWIVSHEGIKYILKDSWVRENRIYDEVAHLSKIKHYKELEDRVPTLICGGDVVINGTRDSTRRYRSAHSLAGPHLVHRCIVTSPVGEPITSCRSKKEFIGIMMNIITSMLTDTLIRVNLCMHHP